MYPCELADILFHSLPPPTPILSRSSGFLVRPHSPTFPTTNSTSDDTDNPRHRHDYPTAAEERRRRRMISNRESAKRSRIRKQRHLDELRLHVSRLHSTNRLLLDELNQLMRRKEDILDENVLLRREREGLQKRLKELKPEHGDPITELSDADHGSCNVAHMRTEAMQMSSCAVSPLVFP